MNRRVDEWSMLRVVLCLTVLPIALLWTLAASFVRWARAIVLYDLDGRDVLAEQERRDRALREMDRISRMLASRSDVLGAEDAEHDKQLMLYALHLLLQERIEAGKRPG